MGCCVSNPRSGGLHGKCSGPNLERNLEDKTYLRDQLREAFRVIDSCLKCIYEGDRHMYRSLAGQLRLLLCDTQRKKDNSLLPAAFPGLEIPALRAIVWSETQAAGQKFLPSPSGTTRVSQMPIDVSVYKNGLVVADLLYSHGHLPVAQWCDQRLTLEPTDLTIREVIKTVADKGGGAHVDADASAQLRFLYKTAPAGRTYAELCICAIGRFVQRAGEKLFKYEGVRVPKDIVGFEYEKMDLIIAAHVDLVNAIAARDQK